MNGHGFSTGEAVRVGWETTTKNLGLLAVAIAIVMAIGIMPAVASDSWVVQAVAWVLNTAVGLGVLRIALRFVDGEKGELVDLFSTLPLIPQYLIASIIIAPIVAVGFVLLIIPGVYWAVRLYMFPWVMVDKGVGPFEALRQSWEITRGSFWNLFGLFILLFGINLLGMIALVVGLLVTIPLSIVAVGYAYRRLEEQAHLN